MTPAVLLLSISVLAAQWRGALGAHVSQTSNGAMDIGWRSGDWQAELLTDTLDIRWRPEDAHGRSWVATRAEFGAAGLMISPWADGAPAPAYALAAFYAGTEAGRIWYLPRGLYAGLDAQARWWWFGGLPDTRRGIPDARARGEGAAILGWWTPPIQAWVRTGAHLAQVVPGAGLDVPTAADHAPAPRAGPRAHSVQPSAHLNLTARPHPHGASRHVWRSGPAGATDRMRSRGPVSGSNPYVVPLSGAAWGEFWVDTYAALRAGPGLNIGTVSIDAVVDAAAWQSATRWSSDPTSPPTDRAAGLGILGRLETDQFRCDLDTGLSPWLPRQQGTAWSVWVAIGVPWSERGSGMPGKSD